MAVFIVDNSVWWKAHSFPAIAARLRTVSTLDIVLTCPPQVLEYCHSARNAAEYADFRADMDSFLSAGRHPTLADFLDIQEDLVQAGYARGAGPIDIQIAAYALANQATVLTADRDFDDIANTTPHFRCEYLPEK